MNRGRHWIVVLVAVFAALVAGGGYWIVLDRRFESGLKQVRSLMAADRFPEARQWLIRQPRWRLENPEAAYRLGVCEHATGNIPAALALWSRVDPDSPWGVKAGLARARTLVGDLGRFRDAELILEPLLKTLQPGADRDEVRHTLSQLYFWEGRRDEMRRLIEAAWNNTTEPLIDLTDHWKIDSGITLIEIIREEIEHAAQLAPEDDRVWLAQARLAMQDGRFEQAGKLIDRCLLKHPEDFAAWRARLDLARASENLGEARQAMAHLPARLFDEDEELALSAWLAAGRGDTEAEREALERLITVQPGESRALDRLATLAWDSGHKELSREYRRRKAELDAAKDRYRELIGETITTFQYAELARLAEFLNRRFEARGWWALRAHVAPRDLEAARAPARLKEPPEPTRPGPDVMLADVLSDVQPGRTVVASESGSKPRHETDVLPYFTEAADPSGLHFVFENGRSPLRQIPETTAGGVGLLDYDGDGWLDVYVVQGGVFPPDPARPSTGDRLFRNKGDGTFEDASESSGISAFSRGFGHGVTVGDFDNDGHPDLFLTRWRAYVLLHNKGDGTFEDVTDASGLGGDRDWPTSAAFADLDNDGDLDLYVCHYLVWDAENPKLCRRATASSREKLSDPGQEYNYCSPRSIPALPDHLFRNDGGRFVDVTAEAGIVDQDGRGLGVVAADMDDDGLVDLFVANDTTANYLWHNLGGMKFEEIGFPSGVACNADGAFQAGMGTACGDLDGDGLPDLCVTNFYGESTTFFQNLGGGMFGDQTIAIGLAVPSRFLLGFGIVLFDANNDGHLDLATANGHVNDDRPDYPYDMPALLMIGGKNGHLTDVTSEAGAPWSVPRVARGLASGDLDNDGRVDAVFLSQKSPLAYFSNQTPAQHFVTFELEGTQSNRDGVGAVVTLEAGGRQQRRWRYGGGSYQSASDPRIHFGLGRQDRLESIEVRWPSGTLDRFTSLEIDRTYRLREGSDKPIALEGAQSH